MSVAFIGIGSNLGDRRAMIAEAVDRLAASPGILSLRLSGLHETDPVGGPPDQASFLNAAARVETALAPEQLLDRLLDIERELGRQRRERWGPRTIDLDMLMYDDRILNTPKLVLPHPRMHQRRFVLEPLAEIGADVVHPVLGRDVQTLLRELSCNA